MLLFSDVNECFDDPCRNGGTCNDLLNMYQCECVIGFAGVNCEEGQYYCNKLHFGPCII